MAPNTDTLEVQPKSVVAATTSRGLFDLRSSSLKPSPLLPTKNLLFVSLFSNPKQSIIRPPYQKNRQYWPNPLLVAPQIPTSSPDFVLRKILPELNVAILLLTVVLEHQTR